MCDSLFVSLNAQQPSSAIKTMLEEKLDVQLPTKIAKAQRLTTSKKKIFFSYQNKELADVIEELAAYKKVNVVFNKDSIKGKLTFSHPKKISVDTAWNILVTILNNAGLVLQSKDSMFVVVPKSNVQEVPPPLYINVPFKELPDSDVRIRYIYYFTKINLGVEDQKTSITTIINDMLPADESGEKGGASILDADMNTLMITTTASRIKSIMAILTTFDESGMREAVVVFNLKYVGSDFVEKLFMGDEANKKGGLLGGEGEDSFAFYIPPKEKKVKKQRYFAENTRVRSIPQINAVVIFGRQDVVNSIIDFVTKYIDVPLEAGSSIIHVKNLDFIKAEDLKKALDGLLKGDVEKDQAKADASGSKTYDFSTVLIEADKPGEQNTETADEPEEQGGKSQEGDTGGKKELKGVVYLGGNRVIVAAREREWKVIDYLIDMLDNPKPQVAIEALIVDISSSDAQVLGMQLRNALFPQLLPQDINFQTSHLNNMWLEFDSSGNVKSPPGLAANLLSVEQKGDKPINITTNFTPPPGSEGSTVVSLSEKQSNGKDAIWAIIQALSSYTTAHVLSRPFVVVSTNEKAVLTSDTVRLLQDAAAADTSGPVKINKKDITAGLNITIVPRVSGSADFVSLQILIDANEFKPGSDTRIIREIETNAIVRDQQILMLGGLDKFTEEETRNETPGIARVPLVGWVFKKKSSIAKKQTLMVFIVPHIIKPRLGGIPTYISPFSQEKIDFMYKTIIDDTQNRPANRDPINRSFFGLLSQDSIDEVDNFLKASRWQISNKKSKKNKSKSKGKPTTTAPLPSNPASSEKLKNMAVQISNPLVK